MVKNKIKIEVAYAKNAREQVIIPCEVPAFSNIAQCVRQSEILKKYSELSLETIQVGVFGVKKNLLDILQDGDRIEIYRPLMTDPKELRRLKAAKKTNRE